MKTTLATIIALVALSLGGCASDPGMGGMVYRDGGYYAPARDGYGDYYLAPDHSDDWAYDGFYDPFYDPFFGPFYDPFVFGPNWYGGGGGYCPVRYRYCPAGWGDDFGSSYYGGGHFGTGLWLSFGSRGGYYDAWRYRDQAYGWRPPLHRRTPLVQGTQSLPLQPQAGTRDGLADAGARDGDVADTGLDGRLLDRNGYRYPDERLLQRRFLRPQPTWTRGPTGSPPPAPNAAWPQQVDRGDRAERSSGSGERSRGERSDGGDRASALQDGDRRPRTRRRDSGF